MVKANVNMLMSNHLEMLRIMRSTCLYLGRTIRLNIGSFYNGGTVNECKLSARPLLILVLSRALFD